MREAREEEEEEEIRASSSLNNTPIPSPALVFHVHLVHMYKEQLSNNVQLLLRFHTCGEVELGRWVRSGLEGGKTGGNCQRMHNYY